MEVLGITLSQGQLWLLAISGWLISVRVSYIVGLNHASAARYAAAAASFRAAVNQTVAELPLGKKSSFFVGDFLPPWDGPVKELVKTIEVAVQNFLPYLPPKKRDPLTSAWSKVKTHCEHGLPGVMGTGIILYADPNGEENARKQLFALLEPLKTHAPEK